MQRSSSPRSGRRATRRVALVAVALLALGVPATACASGEGSSADTPAQAVPQGTTLLDVRNAAEFDAGHLAGAVNVDVEAADFQQQMLAGFDPAGDYFVYCRTGNRAGEAIDLLRAAGFNGELTNYGGLEEAAGQLGLPIVGSNDTTTVPGDPGV